MNFEHRLLSGKLIKRYKRFLADIETPNGQLTIHCPNTGSMKGCAEAGSPVWYWDSENPKRKYRHTWEMLENSQGHRIGINTHRANHLVKEALIENIFPSLAYDELSDEIRTEVKYGDENSRIDILLTQDIAKGANKIWIEVKNTTLLDSIDGNKPQGFFPDAVTSRGTKHLRELMQQVKKGDRAVLVFCVQHTGIESVTAAAHIDPLYAKTLKEAVDAGVEVIATKTNLNDGEIKIVGQLPFVLD